MTQGPPDQSDGAGWWRSSAGVPDVEALLGPDAMAAVGSVADEALKLFVVLRDRAAAAGPPAMMAAQGATPQWGSLLNQMGGAAVRAVNELALAAAQIPHGTHDDFAASESGADATGDPQSGSPAFVAPGEAASCAFCPVCQAIAMFRSVPMSTWQRMAASIIDVADAAREFADPGGQTPSGPVVVQAQAASAGSPRPPAKADSSGPDEDGAASGTIMQDFLAAIERQARHADDEPGHGALRTALH